MFAVQTAPDHETYDPLDVGQWEFYVLPAATVREIGQHSLGLTRLAAIVSPVRFGDLAAAIEEAAQ